MARRVFFSFHYQDVIDFRANVVRNHWVLKEHRDAAGFFDASLWEAAEKTSPLAIKRLINSGLDNTSVTCVLIGSETFTRRWVRYEIVASFRRGNDMFGVHINSTLGKDQKTKPDGPNPFDYLGVQFSDTGLTATMYEIRNGKWETYAEFGQGATYQTGGIASQYHGQFYPLSKFYPTYDWTRDYGYQRFASWVEK